MDKSWIIDLSLEGGRVNLLPLDRNHKKGLIKAAKDGRLWELWYATVPSAKDMETYISHALAEKEKGLEYPFVVVDKETGTIIGSTRFYAISPEHRRLEIGYTWYAKSFQRTGVNTECKYLLLKHAFEQLECIAVQLVTNWHNLRSRAAMERLGAKQDGILRNHRLMADGTYRDTVVFSIIDREWPSVKKSLAYDIGKH